MSFYSDFFRVLNLETLYKLNLLRAPPIEAYRGILEAAFEQVKVNSAMKGM